MPGSNFVVLGAKWRAAVQHFVRAHRHGIRNFLFFCLVAYPAAIALGTSELFDQLVACLGIELVPAERTELVKSAVIRAEYAWGITVVLLIMGCSWTVVHCWRVILWSQPRSAPIQLLCAAVLISLGLAAYLLWPPYEFYNCITGKIFSQTMGDFKSGYGDQTGLAVVLRILVAAQVIGATTVVFVAIASVSVLMVDPANPNSTWQDLQSRAWHLRSVLYAGALGLVTVFLHLQTMFAIPEALIGSGTDPASEADRQELMNLAEGLKIFWGSTLTLLLAAVYVPAAVILRGRSLRLAGQVNPQALPAQIETWMKDRGLMGSWTTQLAKAIAMLSPLLSGPLATFAAKLADVEL